MRKIILGLLALTGLSLMPAQAADTLKALRVGVEGGYAPFSVKLPDGRFEGFDIDIAHAICAQLKMKCELVEISFDSMIPALNVRKIDAIAASMAITDARKQAVNFSDKYFDSPSRMIARAESSFVVTTEGMSGKRIGLQRGTTHERFASDKFTKSTLVRYAKQDEVFMDLHSGRLDAAIMDSTAANEGFLKTPAGNGFGFIGSPFIAPKYFGDGVGIAMRKSDTELLARVNQAIAEIRQNGEFKKIQDKYFDFEIFDK